MSRFPLIPPEQVRDDVARRVFDEIQRDLGFGIVPNVFRAMAGTPWFLKANWDAFRTTVLGGELPRILKEMIGLVVSAVHRSDYARQVHLHSLAAQGVEASVIDALREGRLAEVQISPASATVLQFAHAVATDPHGVTDGQFAELRRLGLGESEILEVIATIQLFTSINLFTDAVGVEVDPL